MFYQGVKLTSADLGNYFQFLFPDRRRGAVVTLAAYFDESDRSEGDAPICVGGYLFKAAAYERFQKRWRREVLRLPDRRQLRHFHMTDLCAGRGEYEGLTIPERVRILDRAVEVIRATFHLAVGIHFLKEEFEQVAPPHWPESRGSIYTLACHMAVQSTAYWLEQEGCHLDVLYVFERGHKFEKEAAEVLQAIAGNADARHDFHYRNHLFEEKDNAAGIQAADLFVWTVTKASLAQGVVPQAVRPFLHCIHKLAIAGNGRQILHTYTGKMLRDLLSQQFSVEGDVIPVHFRPRRRALR